VDEEFQVRRKDEVKHVEELLSPERFASLRWRGWSYDAIAEEVGVSTATVRRYAQRCLRADLRRPVGQVGKVRAQIIELLDQSGGTMPTCEIISRVGCSKAWVQDCRRQWRSDRGLDRRQNRTEVRCQRCGFLGWKENPLGEDGLCLWCRLESEGRDLREMAESGRLRELAGW